MIETLAQPWGELALYYNYALKMGEGLLPYKDFFPEYPPFALYFFKIPLIFGVRYYMLTYYALVALVSILTALLIKRLHGNAWAFLAAVLPLGGLFWDRFDILPAFLSILAIAYASKGKHTLGFLSLSLGFLTKIYPIIFLPILMLYAWGNWKSMFRGLIAFILPVIITVGIICNYGGAKGLIKFVEFQAKRGIHLESVWATPLLIQNLQGTRTFETIYRHNTFELIERTK